MRVLAERLRAAQRRLGPFWWHSALMFVASRCGDVLHVVVGLFLVPRHVPEEQLGAVLPLLSLGVFFSVPLTAAARTTARYVTEFRVAGERGRIRAIVRDLMRLSVLVSACGIAIVWFGQSFLAARLQFEGRAVPLLVGGLIVLSSWLPVLKLANQGMGHYYRISASLPLAAVSRLILALVLLRLWKLEGYLAAMLLGGLAVSLFLGRGLRACFARDVRPVSNRALLAEANRYFLPTLLLTGLFAFQALMEPWIIRQRLPFEESAAYYLATRFGMIPAYLSAPLVAFLFPMVSERHDRGQATRGLKWQSLLAVAATGLLVAVGLALFGERLLGLTSDWRPYRAYASLLWQTALIATGTSLIALYATHETACRRFAFLWVAAPVVLLEIGGLYSLMGWSFFRPYLPASVWAAVDGWIRRDIGFIVAAMLAARAVTLLGMAALAFRRPKHGSESRGPSA